MISQPLRLIINNHLYCSSRAFISLIGPEFQFEVVLQLKSGWYISIKLTSNVCSHKIKLEVTLSQTNEDIILF